MTDVVPFTCSRWSRYGHDRLYVSAADGARVGYRDLNTGLDHPDDEADRSLVTTLADRWAEDHQRARVARPTPQLDEPLERPWRDLSSTPPGAAVLAQAAAYAQAGLDARSWRVGAVGESRVADELIRVWRKQPAWTAIHAIPIGSRGADIDHLVLGPGGVFTVNAKHHRRAKVWVGGETLLVNGARTHHVRNARHEARRASAILSRALEQPIPVQALVVLVNAESITVRAEPEPGVTVLGSRRLSRWLLKLPAVHDQGLLNRIWDVARRSTTSEP